MGVLVDQVLEVQDDRSGEIAPPPDLGVESRDTEFILGVAKTSNRVVFLLDIGGVLGVASGGESGPAPLA